MTDRKEVEFASSLCERAEKLFTFKAAWGALWQEISELVLPRRGSMTNNRTVTGGQELQYRINDGTAPWALEQLASGLHSYLTSAVKRWFRLVLPEPTATQFVDNHNVKQWLQIATEVMYDIFRNSRSNFPSMSHELNLDLAAFGTGVLYVADDPLIGPRFCTYHLADIAIAEDQFGHVDTVVRKFKMARRNAVKKWPKKFSREFMEKAVTQPFEEVEFMHYVAPREEFIVGSRIPKDMPFASFYIYPGEKIILSTSGYMEMPYMVPRWSKLTGETYGRSPAMTCLPDVRLVNAMAKTLLVAAQKTADPPLVLADEGFMLPIRTTPGSLIFKNSSLAGDPNPISPLPVPSGQAIQVGNSLLEQRQQHIIRSFFVDWMQLAQGPQMTATEVVQRVEEKMRLMAPAIARLETEYLEPMLSRVFGICMRQGRIPPPPEELQGQAIKIEFVSEVAKAQKAVLVQNFQALLQNLSGIAQVKPEIMDSLNSDGIVSFLSDVYDVSHMVLLPTEAVAQIRQQRAEQQQQMMQMEQMKAQADMVGRGGSGLAALARAENERT